MFRFGLSVFTLYVAIRSSQNVTIYEKSVAPVSNAYIITMKSENELSAETIFGAKASPSATKSAYKNYLIPPENSTFVKK